MASTSMRNLPKVTAGVAALAVLVWLLAVKVPAEAVAGQLDVTYDGDGIAITDFGSGNDEIHDVAVDANGKMVAGGFATNAAGNTDFALARYNTDGTLDTSFDGDGKVTTGFAVNKNDQINGLTMQPDGKIVVVGETVVNGRDPDWALARYNPNGSLDTSFSGDGKQTTPFSTSNPDQAEDVVFQSDGKIIVTGRVTQEPDLFQDVAVARYNSNGALDGAFDGDGKVTTDLSGSEDIGNDVAIDGNGKYVVAGLTIGNGVDTAVVRYNTDGSLDATFSGDGKLIADSILEHAESVAIDGTKIVTGGMGHAQPTLHDFTMARFNSDGTDDTTFDGDGRAGFNGTNNGDLHQIHKLILPGDTKYVAVGWGMADGRNFALARLNNNGSLDTTFGAPNGWVLTDASGGGRVDQAFGAALQPDNKIVAAGFATNVAGNTDFALARYLYV